MDLVLISDVIYGSNPGVWDRLIASLLALTTPGRTLVLQSESFRLEALLYHEYWACLEQAGFRVTEVAVGGASLGWGRVRPGWAKSGCGSSRGDLIEHRFAHPST